MKADFKDSHPKKPGKRRGGKRGPKRPNNKRGATANKAGHAGWPWLLAGVLIGLFVAFLWYLNQHAPTVAPAPHTSTPASRNDAAPTTVVPRAEPSQRAGNPAGLEVPPAQAAEDTAMSEPEVETESTEPEAPDWRFYRLLEEQQVEVPVERIRTPRADKAPDPEQRMALQVGSFRNLADADRLKAELALLGYEADIVVTDTESHGKWHRVRLGPYDDPRALAKDRAKLYTRNIESLPIKLTQ